MTVISELKLHQIINIVKEIDNVAPSERAHLTYFKISVIVIYREEQHRVSDQKERGIKRVGWVSEGGTM